MIEVTELLSQSNLSLTGKIKWGNSPNENNQGIYIVALKEPLNEAPIDIDKVKSWINTATNMTVDNQTPTVDKLVERLSKFWIPDEKILYIGQTTQTLNNRLSQYYRHKLGRRGPHSGGHWIKTLKNIDELDVYFSVCSNPVEAEAKLLKNFINNVSMKSKNNLFDSNRPFPFANLTCSGYGRKAHFIAHQRL